MKTTFALGFLFYSMACIGQNNPQNIVDKFFKLYDDNKVDEAIEYIFSTNQWIDNSKDQVENVKIKLTSTLKLLGTYRGHDQITRESIADRLTLYTFLIRYDRQPIRFSLLFYNPSNQWKLLHFSYDDKLADELQEASRHPYLKHSVEN